MSDGHDGTAGWPFDAVLEELSAIEAENLNGAARLGDIPFDQEPEKLHSIVEMVQDFRLEDRESVDKGIVNEIANHLNQVKRIVEQMIALSAGVSNAVNQRNDLRNQLESEFNWFRGQLPHRSIVAKIRTEMAVAGGADLPLASDEMASIRRDLSELRALNSELRSQIDAQIPAVDAIRQAAGSSGAEDLAASFRAESELHRKAWELWGMRLLATLVLTVCAALVLFLAAPLESSATNGEIARHLVFQLLVLGLFIYGVRMTSLQFRVHRHLDAVARNKAAALETFSRITASSSELEVRSAIATVLAQSVFESQQTGFIGTDSDGVTIIERVAAPITQRAAAS